MRHLVTVWRPAKRYIIEEIEDVGVAKEIAKAVYRNDPQPRIVATPVDDMVLFTPGSPWHNAKHVRGWTIEG